MRVRLLQRCIFTVLITLFAPLHASWFSDRIGINVDLNKQVGTGIASMGAPVAEKFEESGNRLIDKMSGELDKKITQADALATKHEAIFFQKVSSTLASVDKIIQSDIQLADDIVAKRLGNADVIATKAEIGFEAVIRHVLLFGAVLVFLVVVILRWLDHVKFTEHRSLDAAIVLGSLALVYGVYIFLPHGNIGEVIADHEQGYNQAMTALDFREALYHLAQLKILKPGGNVLGREKKVALLEDVLTRPFVYHTQAGIRTLLKELNQASTLLPNDPDVKVVDAFITWQLGPSRIDEYAAAAICGQTLKDHPKDTPGQFFLRPLAVQYVRNYMLNPLPVEEIILAKNDLKRTFPGLVVPDVPEKELADLVQQRNASTGDPLNPIFDIVNFDRLTTDLYNSTIPAYVGMVYADSQVTSSQDPTVQAAQRGQRDRFAMAIGTAWQLYDEQISRLNPEAIVASQRIGTWALQKAGQLRKTPGQYTIDNHGQKMAAVLDVVLPPKMADGTSENFARTLLTTESTLLNAASLQGSAVFEQQLLTFVQKLNGGTGGEKLDAASKLEVSAANMGLFVCGDQYSCDGGGRRRDFSQVVRDTIKPAVGESATFYQDLYVPYQARTLALW